MVYSALYELVLGCIFTLSPIIFHVIGGFLQYWPPYCLIMFNIVCVLKQYILAMLGYMKCIIKIDLGIFLVVQWLRLCASTAGGVGLIPNWGTKILHVMENGYIYTYIYIYNMCIYYIILYINIYTLIYMYIKLTCFFLPF